MHKANADTRRREVPAERGSMIMVGAMRLQQLVATQGHLKESVIVNENGIVMGMLQKEKASTQGHLIGRTGRGSTTRKITEERGGRMSATNAGVGCCFQ
jgi:hypothetical protein